MILLICGSRTIKLTPPNLQRVLNQYKLKPDKIIHGGAFGVDASAGWYSHFYGIPCEVFWAKWREEGRSAGYKRNIIMLENCDEVLAIWDSVSRGTAHTIREAKKRKLPLYIHQDVV